MINLLDKNDDTLSIQRQTHEIENIAEETRKLTNSRNIPINIIEIAKNLNFEIYAAKFKKKDVSGMVIDSHNKKAIYVNKTDSPERKRFSISHKLGHILLHRNSHNGFTWIESSNSFGKEEEEADLFALCLLIPKERVIVNWNRYKNVEKLAKQFFVSKSVMTNRLKNLGLVS